jgi:cold shock CspA family protein
MKRFLISLESFLHPQSSHGSGALNLTDSVKLSASKAIDTLGLTDRAYSLGIWTSPVEKNKWLNDIAVFIAFDDLASITLELFDSTKTVVGAVSVRFDQNAKGDPITQVGGTEVPVLQRSLVAGHRVIVVWKTGKKEIYRHLLKFDWQTAENLQRHPGDEFANSQARKTGGRQSGSIFSSADSRHELIVTRPLGTNGYGFADCPSLKRTGIFLHARYLRGVEQIKLGQRLTAQIIQLPTGLQAREVRTV